MQANGNIVYKDVIINWLDCKSTRPLVKRVSDAKGSNYSKWLILYGQELYKYKLYQINVKGIKAANTNIK